MKNPFKIGEKKQYKYKVQSKDFAYFEEEGLIHPVLSTFTIARCAEWVCRLFVHEMKEEGEEGVGVMVSVNHHSPALENEIVIFTAELTDVERNKVVCQWNAKVQERLIASGEQVQKIVNVKKFYETLANLK